MALHGRMKRDRYSHIRRSRNASTKRGLPCALSRPLFVYAGVCCAAWVKSRWFRFSGSSRCAACGMPARRYFCRVFCQAYTGNVGHLHIVRAARSHVLVDPFGVITGVPWAKMRAVAPCGTPGVSLRLPQFLAAGSLLYRELRIMLLRHRVARRVGACAIGCDRRCGNRTTQCGHLHTKRYIPNECGNQVIVDCQRRQYPCGVCVASASP